MVVRPLKHPSSPRPVHNGQQCSANISPILPTHHSSTYRRSIHRTNANAPNYTASSSTPPPPPALPFCLAYGFANLYKHDHNAFHLFLSSRAQPPSSDHPLFSPFLLRTPVQYTTPVPTRADTSHSTFNTDDKSAINFTTNNETPWHAWNIEVDNKPIVTSLPILNDTIPHADACHHDSGANRHVFHNRSAFETYQPIRPIEVKGFRHNLSTTAIGRGTVRVNGHYGARVSPIVLHNVLHISAARSNLISGPQLDLARVSSLLGDGLATLSVHGENVIGGSLHNNMYCLNMSIVCPTHQHPLLSRLDPPSLLSRITPLAAAASSDQTGFYIA